MTPLPPRRRIVLPIAASLAGLAQPAAGKENSVRTILFSSLDVGSSTFEMTSAKIALDDVTARASQR